MSIQTAATEHALNVIRREFSEEFDDLAVVFIVHEPQKRAAALAAKQEEILRHPAGEILYAHLQQNIGNAPEKSAFAGMAHAFIRTHFGLVKKDRTLAAAFISTSDIQEENDRVFAAKYLGYFLAWEALDLWSVYKESGMPSSGNISRRTPIGVQWLRKQMLADCFAAMMMETKGHKGTIQNIVKKRCELCITPSIGYDPEDYPFPLAVDATHLVYKDIKDAALPKVGPLMHTAFMTHEIGETYDDTSLTQWVTFARAVQEMAWTGHNKMEILGTAAFSGEDPYIRSTAYIMAESLHIDPAPVKTYDFYNPFTEQETNQRLHNKRARALFTDVIDMAAIEDDPSALLLSARRSNAELLDGNPAGWCALPLMSAYEAYNQTGVDENMTAAERAVLAFQTSVQSIQWKEILRFHRALILARRRGEKMTLQAAIAIAHSDKILARFAKAFEI